MIFAKHVAAVILGCVYCGMAGAQTSAPPREVPVSEAESLLFETPHLEKIKKPASLRYKFVRTGTLEENFKDNVEIEIKIDKSGTKTVVPKFLSGARKVPFPEVPEATSNVVILFFLENDLIAMNRLTQGSKIYFQRKMRNALAENAQVQPVTFKFNGKQVNGSEIRISPYVNDPDKYRYEKYAEKYYVFTLSESVPGWVYQMRSVIPDPASDKKPLAEESMTLSNFTGG